MMSAGTLARLIVRPLGNGWQKLAAGLAACLPAEPPVSDFAPALLRLQNSPPAPLGRRIVWTLCLFLAALILWATFGRLDIVAVADGKLVPRSYVKIVQPAEAGIVEEIMVSEGGSVAAGEVLMRMNTLLNEAESRALQADYERKRLALRRIDAELGSSPFRVQSDDPPTLALEVAAQYQANRRALEAALDEERARLARARRDLAAAEQVKTRIEAVLPHYRDQDLAYQKLVRDGFAGNLMGSDKRRERIEKEQELITQGHLIESARAGIAQSEKKLAQIDSDARRSLHAERNETQAAFDRLAQELAKQAHRKALHELRAPQAGVVKDLATHSSGTVVQQGTVLLTLVPKGDILRAEVWVSNEDIGFVRKAQPARIKLAAYPFQKYGMLDGVVEHVSADAAEPGAGAAASGPGDGARGTALRYKALVSLQQTALEIDGERLELSPGMQASAEIHLGHRSVIEYLFSPVQKAWHEKGRER